MIRIGLLLICLLSVSLESSAQYTFSYTNGPAGGVHVFDAINHGGVWYAAAGKALFRSEDDGASWDLVSEGLPQLDIAPRSFATFDGRLYMSTNSQHRILRSADGGYSWEAFNLNLPHLFGVPTYMAVKMIVNNDRLIALPWGAAAIVYLDPGDEEWNETEFSGPVGNGLRAIGGDTLLASIASEHRISTDNGTTWEPFPTNPPVSLGAVGANDFMRSGGVVTATTVAGGFSTTYYSEDELATWNVSDPGFRTGDAGGDRMIKVSEDLIVAIADSGIAHSTDHGRSWTRVDDSTNRIDGVTTFIKLLDGNRLLVGTSADLYFLEDLGRGTRTNLHVPGAQTHLLGGLIEVGGALYALHGGLISRYNASGPSWTFVADAGADHLTALGDGLAYVKDGGIFVSRNLPEFEEVAAPEGIEPVSIHAIGQTWYLVGGLQVTYSWGTYWTSGTLHRSDDNGGSWTEVETTLPTGQLSADPLFTGYELIEHDGVLLLSGDRGHLRSTSGGSSWTKDGDRRTRIIPFDGVLFQVTSSDFSYNVTRSIDNGETWETYLDGFPESNAFSREPRGLARVGDKLYAFNAPVDPRFNPGEAGLFVLESSSGTWSHVTEDAGLGKEPSGLYGYGDLLFAAIDNIGLFQLQPGETGTSREIADGFSSPVRLSQNYPNPFPHTTRIRYNLAREGHVRLRVFDVLGRQVSMLVDERMPAGTHEVSLNAVGLPTGTYLYRLDNEGISQSRQFVIVR